MAVLLAITIMSAAGSRADVHIDDGRRRWQRCFGRCCELEEGDMYDSVYRWLSFLHRHVCGSVGTHLALLSSTSRIPTSKKKKSWHHSTAEKSEGPCWGLWEAVFLTE